MSGGEVVRMLSSGYCKCHEPGEPKSPQRGERLEVAVEVEVVGASTGWCVSRGAEG